MVAYIPDTKDVRVLSSGIKKPNSIKNLALKSIDIG